MRKIRISFSAFQRKSCKICARDMNKNLSTISQGESSSIHSLSLIPPLECGAQSDIMRHAPQDGYGNINCPGEKDNRENHPETVKCNEQGSSMGAESYSKRSGFKLVQDLEYPLYNVRENSHLTGKFKRETLCSQNELGCNENGFDYKVESPKISSHENSLAFAREVGVSDAPQIRSRNLNHGTCLADNGFTSSIKSSKAVPTFEFYVSSEKGINLLVNLNSSPSDWSKILESEVCGCHYTHDNKFGSLRMELELLGNSNKQMKNYFLWPTVSEHNMDNGHVQAESSSYSIKRECDPIVVDHPYGGDGSLRSSPIKPYNGDMDISAQLNEDKEFSLLSTPNYNLLNLVTSSTEPCPIDREIIPFESCVINNPLIKSTSYSVANSIPEGPESLNSLKHQNSAVVDHSCENLTLQNTCAHVSLSPVHPGSSSSCSMEMQSSEVVSQQKEASYSPCRNNGFLDVVESDPMFNEETRDDELANSSTCQDVMSACSEEWERSKLISGAETSESLLLKKSLEKTSDGSEADKVLKRKRQHSEGKDLNCCGKINGKILRSRKHLPERVLPRRSMRLDSK